jgi:dCTP deaminase
MAFISIKARIKWRGLINVSGFHVDPGYEGRLIFAVLNGGPAAVHLRRGDPCFLMWFADLDRWTERARVGPGHERISADLVSNVASDFKTVAGVAKSVDRLKTELRVTQATTASVLALALAVAAHFLWPSTQNVGSSPPGLLYASPAASQIPRP